MRIKLDVVRPAVLAAACLSGLVGGCAEGPSLPPPSFVAADGEVLQRAYRLGVGDKLKVTVFGEENLSGTVEVNAIGQVALPLAGEVPAKGMALDQFRDAVARRLSDGYLKNPKVTVEIVNYRPIYVHGEVRSGGEFAFKPGLKLRDAIAMAGGYTYRANQGHLFIVREGQAEARLPTPNDIAILPGDNIRVPERFF